MKHITIIDDDLAMEILGENLRYAGLDVVRFSSAKDALDNMGSVVKSDFVVLDIIMECPANLAGSVISGDKTTGMEIFQRIRKEQPRLPILVFSATSDADVIQLLKRDQYTSFLQKWSTPTNMDVIRTIEAKLGIDNSAELPRVFIVHGRDEKTKLAVKNYLQNTLKLPEPIILHEQPNLGRTVIKKFEHYSAQSYLAFVILTPDDKIVELSAENDEKRQARQNVILELGFFLGALGRSSGRIFLLHKGPIDLPSDLSGVIYIDISKGIDAAGVECPRFHRHLV